MRKLIQIILILTLISSCGNRTKQNENGVETTENSQTDIGFNKKTDSFKSEKKIGLELFKSIIDTVKIQSITKDLLIKNEWLYTPFENCVSYFKFQDNGKGICYNCEMEDEYELTFRIEDNKILISEYDIPHVDNEKREKIKFRDDTYVYNGQSLVMVDSKMYNIGGLEWIPKIEVVIEYKRKKY